MPLVAGFYIPTPYEAALNKRNDLARQPRHWPKGHARKLREANDALERIGNTLFGKR